MFDGVGKCVLKMIYSILIAFSGVKCLINKSQSVKLNCVPR